VQEGVGDDAPQLGGLWRTLHRERLSGAGLAVPTARRRVRAVDRDGKTRSIHTKKKDHDSRENRPIIASEGRFD
jgi:hypothetical protein